MIPRSFYRVAAYARFLAPTTSLLILLAAVLCGADEIFAFQEGNAIFVRLPQILFLPLLGFLSGKIPTYLSDHLLLRKAAGLGWEDARKYLAEYEKSIEWSEKMQDYFLLLFSAGSLFLFFFAPSPGVLVFSTFAFLLTLGFSTDYDPRSFFPLFTLHSEKVLNLAVAGRLSESVTELARAVEFLDCYISWKFPGYQLREDVAPRVEDETVKMILGPRGEERYVSLLSRISAGVSEETILSTLRGESRDRESIAVVRDTLTVLADLLGGDETIIAGRPEGDPLSLWLSCALRWSMKNIKKMIKLILFVAYVALLMLSPQLQPIRELMGLLIGLL